MPSNKNLEAVKNLTEKLDKAKLSISQIILD